MDKSNELLRMERDLNGHPELREKLDAEIRRIADAGEAQSDGEIAVKAAASLGYAVAAEELERAAADLEKLGYSITPEELERTTADLEKLDDDELEASGGNAFTREKKTDEYGHDEGCVLTWHCFAAFLHTEAESKDVSCWKDHKCVVVNKDIKI